MGGWGGAECARAHDGRGGGARAFPCARRGSGGAGAAAPLPRQVWEPPGAAGLRPTAILYERPVTRVPNAARGGLAPDRGRAPQPARRPPPAPATAPRAPRRRLLLLGGLLRAAPLPPGRGPLPLRAPGRRFPPPRRSLPTSPGPSPPALTSCPPNAPGDRGRAGGGGRAAGWVGGDEPSAPPPLEGTCGFPSGRHFFAYGASAPRSRLRLRIPPRRAPPRP